MDIKRAWIRLIEKYADPFAPVKLQEAFGSLERLGTMLAPGCDQTKVQGYSDRLMGSWTEKELNSVSRDPEFIMALAGMLSTSLKYHASDLGK